MNEFIPAIQAVLDKQIIDENLAKGAVFDRVAVYGHRIFIIFADGKYAIFEGEAYDNNVCINFTTNAPHFVTLLAVGLIDREDYIVQNEYMRNQYDPWQTAQATKAREQIERQEYARLHAKFGGMFE